MIDSSDGVAGCRAGARLPAFVQDHLFDRARACCACVSSGSRLSASWNQTLASSNRFTDSQSSPSLKKSLGSVSIVVSETSLIVRLSLSWRAAN